VVLKTFGGGISPDLAAKDIDAFLALEGLVLKERSALTSDPTRNPDRNGTQQRQC